MIEAVRPMAAGPAVVTRLSVDRRRSTAATVRFVAELDPAPGPRAQGWWAEQLGRHVKVCGWSGSPGQFLVQVEADRRKLEEVAATLLAAVGKIGGPAAKDRPREQLRFASDQAVLDRLLSQYLGEL